MIFLDYLRAAAELTTVCRALITHISTVIVSITQIWTWDANVGWLALCVFWLARSLSWDHHKVEHTVFNMSNNSCDDHLFLFNFCSKFWILTAVLLIWGSIVIAVVDSIANIILCNTAPIVARELCVGVTWSKQTAHFITVVSTVIIMIAAVVVGHTAPIATSKHSRLTGVEGCQSESSRCQISGWERGLIHTYNESSFYLTRQ